MARGPGNRRGRRGRRGRLLATAVALVVGAAVAACTDADRPPADGVKGAATTISRSATPLDDPEALVVRVGTDTPVAEVDERFLSVGIDQAQLVGGTFWDPAGGSDAGATAGGSADVEPYALDRPALVERLAPLAPALLRVGGTASDGVFYDLGDLESTTDELPPGYDTVLTAERWAELNAFAEAVGFEVAVTLNAGPGPRGPDGAWQPDQARALVAHTVDRGYPVAAWSLGNEPNYFPLNFDGPGPEAFAEDYARFVRTVREVDPDAVLAGPASAYWPQVGELVPVTGPFLAAGGGDGLDVVTWHYYPQQSDRCPAAVVRADAAHALDPVFLDEVGRWADAVATARDELAPGRVLWLQETGNAQCGGQVGLSDRAVATFWWVDQLGQLARRDHDVVVRWNVSGADYGLLRESDLDPNPDWWTSLLWRRLMGSRVLATDLPTDRPTVRAYAHCRAGGAPGAVSVVVLNLDRQAPARIGFPGLAGGREAYLVTVPDLAGRELVLNGAPLALDSAGAPPAFVPEPLDGSLELPPASLAFVSFPDAGAAACR